MPLRRSLIALLVPLALAACDVRRVSGDHGGAGSGLSADQRYVVQRGDTLFSIAERAYGNGLEWPRLYEANPWVDPDRLRPGQIVYIPQHIDEFTEGPQAQTREVFGNPGFPAVERDGALTTANPGTDEPDEDGGSGAMGMFRNIGSSLSGSSMFGYTVDKLGFFVLLGAIFHAALQGFILWITTNITFVKDTTIKKSMHASFLAELLTLCTVAMLAVVGLLMTYAGTSQPGVAPSSEILQSVEQFLRTDFGMGAVSFSVLALYVILSLRFVPQTFGIHRSQAFTVVFLGVLLPHLVGMYLMGRRMGIIDS